MREIISIHIGQAGLNIGSASWELYCLEHGISPDGTSSTITDKTDCSSFFSETGNGKMIPRSIMVDSEPYVMHNLRCGKYKDLYAANSFVSGKEDASNNFAKGYYDMISNDSVLEGTMDRLRIIVEEADSLQGFMIYHSTCGGTGSGFGAHLFEYMNEVFYKKPKVQFVLIPAPRMGTAVVEPYNAMLALHKSINYFDCSFVIDNEAVFDVYRNKLGLHYPYFSNLNHLISQLVSSITASLRFHGTMNMDLNDFRTNLVPFNRIHYIIPSLSPIIPTEKCPTHVSMSEISYEIFQPSNQSLKCDYSNGMYLACCLLYRGHVVNKHIKECVATLKAKNIVKFVDWCPTGFRVGINPAPTAALDRGDFAKVDKSVCLLSNTTAVITAWEEISRKFDLMYNKGAFLHWYFNYGMEDSDFKDAKNELIDLRLEYADLLRTSMSDGTSSREDLGEDCEEQEEEEEQVQY